MSSCSGDPMSDAIDAFANQYGINPSEASQVKQNLGMMLRSGRTLGGKRRKYRGGAPCTTKGVIMILAIAMAVAAGSTGVAYCVASSQLTTLIKISSTQLQSMVQGLVESITITVRTGNPEFMKLMWKTITTLSTGIGLDKIAGMGTNEGSLLLGMIHNACSMLGLSVPVASVTAGGRRRTRRHKKTKRRSRRRRSRRA
jgi:hypothetical protein